MKSYSVDQAKNRFSEIIDAVANGEDVEITCDGVPIARMSRPAKERESGFDLAEFLTTTLQQPLHPTQPDDLIRELRSEARY
jgi:antitoxin (DNA-binding transcriptional repressor) of toxin-antitoxin stability system